jgi:hypothetical protein
MKLGFFGSAQDDPTGNSPKNCIRNEKNFRSRENDGYIRISFLHPAGILQYADHRLK